MPTSAPSAESSYLPYLPKIRMALAGLSCTSVVMCPPGLKITIMRNSCYCNQHAEGLRIMRLSRDNSAREECFALEQVI